MGFLHGEFDACPKPAVEFSQGIVFVVGFTESSPLSPLQKCQKDVGDDDVFMVSP